MELSEKLKDRSGRRAELLRRRFSNGLAGARPSTLEEPNRSSLRRDAESPSRTGIALETSALPESELRQARFELRRNVGDDNCVVPLIVQLQNVPNPVNLGEQRRFVSRYLIFGTEAP